jgi:hypothetical protein
MKIFYFKLLFVLILRVIGITVGESLFATTANSAHRRNKNKIPKSFKVVGIHYSTLLNP